MAKRNPFDVRRKPPAIDTSDDMRPDADIHNADWPKRTADVSANGSIVHPKIVTPEK